MYLLSLCHVVGIVLCKYANLLQCIMGQLIFIHSKERLPEAICCCLQTCYVDVVLLVMYCMCIPALIVASADISQLCNKYFLLISALIIGIFS